MSYWVMSDGSVKELNPLTEQAALNGQNVGTIAGPFDTADELFDYWGMNLEFPEFRPQSAIEHPIVIVGIALIIIAIAHTFNVRGKR